VRVHVTPGAVVGGEATVPGDKSIAHRWLLLATIASGRSVLRALPPGLDVLSTSRACARLLPRDRSQLEAWVARVEGRASGEPDPVVEGRVEVEAAGRTALRRPAGPIDCGNSGTTMRLLAGMLAGTRLRAVLDGDASLRSRPMERVAEPLRRMGADVATAGGHPPVTVRGGPLHGIRHEAAVPSAQVKGAVLLAGLAADGTTEVVESAPTRDHTERALAALGAPVRSTPLDGAPVSAAPHGRGSVQGSTPTAGRRRSVAVERFDVPGFSGAVPGDVSSAAFLIGAALVTGGHVTVTGVGLNPSRLHFLDVLSRMGGRVDREVESEELGEPVGVLRARAGAALAGTVVTEAELPEVVDEIPLLAVVAALAGGETRFEGAGELRVKESDRLAGLRDLVRGLGGHADVEGDTLVVGGGGLSGGVADSGGDHRMAMAAVVGALAATGPSEVSGAEAAAVSYPGFTATMLRLGAGLEVEP
jgi:3-phosphoshikimate 1-carboxyvinyltransferase